MSIRPSSVVATLPLWFAIATAGAQVPSAGTFQNLCPSTTDFASAATSSTVLSVSVDSLWSVADAAVRMWADSVFFVKGTQRRRNSALSDPATTQAVAQVATPSTKATCYFERRIGNRDSRIAFRLVVVPSKGKIRSTTLTVYRLSQTKGAVQRTWSFNPTGSDVLAARLIDHIRAQLRPAVRR